MIRDNCVCFINNCTKVRDLNVVCFIVLLHIHLCTHIVAIEFNTLFSQLFAES